MDGELTIAEFKKLGFLQGKSNPCIYYHSARELRTEVHGDDFTSVGSFEDIKWFHTSAAKEWHGKSWNEAFSVHLDHKKPANRSEC